MGRRYCFAGLFCIRIPREMHGAAHRGDRSPAPSTIEGRVTLPLGEGAGIAVPVVMLQL